MLSQSIYQVVDTILAGNDARLQMHFENPTSTHNVNVQDEYGRSFLHWTAAQGKANMAQLLLSYGADPLMRNMVGRTPIHYAAQHGQRQVLELLVAHIGAVTPSDVTPASSAAPPDGPGGKKGAAGADKKAESKGSGDRGNPPGNSGGKAASTRKTTSGGPTTAASQDSLRKISNAIQLVDGELNTALHIAVAYDQPTTVEALLKLGASKTSKNVKGETSLEMAVRLEVSPIIVKLLEQKDAKPASKPTTGTKREK